MRVSFQNPTKLKKKKKKSSNFKTMVDVNIQICLVFSCSFPASCPDLPVLQETEPGYGVLLYYYFVQGQTITISILEIQIREARNL